MDPALLLAILIIGGIWVGGMMIAYHINKKSSVGDGDLMLGVIFWPLYLIGKALD
jgi:hypothetical protein